MAEVGGGPQHPKIRILGHDGDTDLEETSRCFPLQKIGYISQGLNETCVWIHSSEGAGKGEKGGKGSMKGEFGGFPGGTVLESPPADAGNTGSCPGPGRSHMPRRGAAGPVSHGR